MDSGLAHSCLTSPQEQEGEPGARTLLEGPREELGGQRRSQPGDPEEASTEQGAKTDQQVNGPRLQVLKEDLDNGAGHEEDNEDLLPKDPVPQQILKHHYTGDASLCDQKGGTHRHGWADKITYEKMTDNKRQSDLEDVIKKQDVELSALTLRLEQERALTLRLEQERALSAEIHRKNKGSLSHLHLLYRLLPCMILGILSCLLSYVHIEELEDELEAEKTIRAKVQE
ncbi:putative uncharacterized protein MYH16 [Dendropsophus ebraccatus]|uniref:putative uncharacterized protein MYH16 n=1 Tax=Dendropsophus ebraccatus TaxID=150705 RepID=UPI003831CE1C